MAKFLPVIQNNQSGSVRRAVRNVTYTGTGQTFLSANCSGMKIEIPVAVIKDPTADVILGHDFLVKYEVILDYAAHEIFMGKDRRLRVAWKDGDVVNHSTCRPTVPEEVQIEEVKLGPLESSDEEKLKQLLGSFPEVITEMIGYTTTVKHKIECSNYSPIKQRPYPINPDKRKFVTSKILEWRVKV